MLLFNGFKLDRQRAELRGPGGEAIKLRPKTFDMLAYMAENGGRVLSKQELMERFWPGLHVGEDSLFQCIREIRSALSDDRRQLVKNISGRGYLFAPDVARVESPPGNVEPTSVPAVRSGTAADGGGDAILLVSEPPQIALQDDARPHGVPDHTVLASAATMRAPEPFADPAHAIVALHRRRLRPGTLAGVAAVAAALIAAAVLLPMLRAGQVFEKAPLSVTVAQLTAVGDDPQIGAVARGVTDRLNNGLARIENIRVVVPAAVTAHASFEVASARSVTADYAVTGDLQHGEQGWILRARLTRTASGEIAWATTVDINATDIDLDMQQSRLAAGLGHPLAMRLNAIINDNVPSASKAASGSAQVAIEQAVASITQTTQERFRAAQMMLETALAEAPDNVDLQAALAALQLRGIQMVWYSPAERDAAKAKGTALLERALQAKPSYIPVLESYCRFLSATNRFIDSLVACARTLSFDPWNGIALYHIGLGQMFLGRFEDALSNLKQADRFDTPRVSRWTWSLVAGICEVYLGHDEEGIAWLRKSLAVTPGTGRTHFTLVAAHQRLGQHKDAQEMLRAGLALRPGATAENVGPPTENTSPVYLAAATRVRELLIEAGLPER